MFGEVHEGDVLEVLRATPDATYHGCLTDPPYGLSFMGHGWDHGVPSAEVWREVLRVMRPGAYLLAFGGTRTFHRLTCAIEDAGFEVRDVIAWMYGSGFPKSHDVSKALDREAGAVREVVGKRTFTGKAAQDWREKGGDTFNAAAPSSAGCVKSAAITAPATEAARQWAGYGTALKPAYEPILVARKPLEGTVAANAQAHGCGGLAIDACRVEAAGRPLRLSDDRPSVVAFGDGLNGSRAAGTTDLGRWPANVILDEEAGAALDAQSGERRPERDILGGKRHGKRLGTLGAFDGQPCERKIIGDGGGASRFFYCAKASRAERGEGNIHPTVKPLTLARYLARLILPPVEGARLVVPFCGSGSEVIGALQAGWSHVEGIDSWDVAVRIARARIAHHIAGQQMELAHVGT